MPAGRIKWIGRLGKELGAGGAIRVGRDWATSEDVDRIVGHLELDVTQIDLIVDLQYLDFCSPQLVEWTLATFAALRRSDGFGR